MKLLKRSKQVQLIAPFFFVTIQLTALKYIFCYLISSINKLFILTKNMFFFFFFGISELMLMGFISLLLTIGQTPISNICISQSVASTMHPCSAADEAKKYGKKVPAKQEDDGKDKSGHRRLLLEVAESYIHRRSLATKGYDKCAEKVTKNLPYLYIYINHSHSPC